MTGTVVSINVSDGGVPKLPVDDVEVTAGGLSGDRQRDLRHHGGAERAVSALCADVIEKLAAEGHPIAPGTTGENLTIHGLDWASVTPGNRLVFAGGVELVVTSYANPCPNIAASFAGGEFKRIHHELHPGESRIYMRVLTEGRIEAGEGVRLETA